MKASAGPATRLLARDLAHWRNHRRITLDRAAATLKCSPARISRLEHGYRQITIGELGQLIALYRADDDTAGRMRELHRQSLHEIYAGLRDHELAAEVLAWAVIDIPLPLRAEPYARAVLASVRRVRQFAATQIKDQMFTIRDWQERLRGDNPDAPPLTLTCLLDESVLTRLRGSTSAMTAQMDLLAALAALDTTTIRIVPHTEPAAPAFGPFTLLGFDDELADIVLTEGPGGTTRLAGDDRAAMAHRDAFTDLAAAACPPEESAVLIKAAADRWAG